MSEPWQDEYVRELRRTAGYGARFAPMRGGWWRLEYEDGFRGRSTRRSHVEQWTAALRLRPDNLSAPVRET